ncbi:Methylmalonate semialdehyde dehydrogenase [acylating] [Streptomyces sp. MBT84]|nr:Methylmalonate semialdehyde dehydrogenase [acylating] [Streptomyces sp. MBT84]
MKTVTHCIGGKPFGDASGATGAWAPVSDPATGEVTTHVALTGADEVDAAVAAAKAAYTTWSMSPLAQRIAILFRYRALLDARRDDIAALITAEQGKSPLVTKEHRDEVAEYVAGAAAQGAEVVLDGRDFTVRDRENGHWMGISLLDRVRTDGSSWKSRSAWWV